MGLHVEKPMLKLSAYTNEDKDSNAMLKAHAYQAVSAGFVTVHAVASDGLEILALYVGLTNDPVGAGDLIFRETAAPAGASNYIGCGGIPVAKNEYFEITYNGAGAVVIRWKSLGLTLKRPLDFN